ncbi:MAG: hypothetical protein ACYC7D_12435 [Nitrososphaerales archaeon]
MSGLIGFGTTDIILGSIELFLAIIVIIIFVIASRRFAGGIGNGLYLISGGVFFSAISFILGLAVESQLAGQKTALAQPAWVQEITIFLALVLFLSGSIILYRTARRIAREAEKPTSSRGSVR